MSAPVTRRLAAVVMADVVGYSRMMERDESGTRERTRALHEALIAPKAAEFGGRIVKTAGDGFMLEFASATAALRFAVDLQRELGVRNLYTPRDRRMALRIGINLGDVIVENEDIFGDGVNIAARLQTLAEPGGICVSSAIVDQVHEDLGVEFIDAGVQHVKNISKPIPVFHVGLAGDAGPGAEAGEARAPAQVAAAAPRQRSLRRAIAAVAVPVIGAIVLAAWWVGTRTPPTDALADRDAASGSIMIVPFSSPPDDAELRALADALTTATKDSLSTNFRSLAVVVRDGVARPASADDRIALARSTHARYLVEGAVAAVGGDVVANARLIDVARAKDLGGERQVVARATLATEHDRLAKQIPLAIRGLIGSVETRRHMNTPLPPDASAQDHVDRAVALAYRSEHLPSLREARKLLDEAIRRDPTLVTAWTRRANTLFAEWMIAYAADDARLLAEMDRDSLRAVALDDRYPPAWVARTNALMAQKRFDAALAAYQRATLLDPTQSGELKAANLNLMGRSEEALALTATRNPVLHLGGELGLAMITCEAYVNLGRYEKAIAECGRALTNDDSHLVHFNLVAAYAQVGDMANAKTAREELMLRIPDFSIARYQAKWSDVPAWIEQQHRHVFPGLRKAGVPD